MFIFFFNPGAAVSAASVFFDFAKVGIRYGTGNGHSTG
ncbi:hypothetical protein M079_3556 [Bacteroides fragilis str. 3996 N(B) 6]|uniref:Uncharacterized protein n=1 Tax=Bacteroides fragilis str. 3998T(B)3 TaxID=1339316 RepID=A0A015V299_BACFG|nr:hypothetical protein M079_3556 [Bacteroides fragilis str. 3996 N(B) 6]EXY89377.1 hypothetical protein M125_3947 [Bacteroides fragilis str. 3998T(B)3]EXY94324.1 hypothetical protein M081_3552 [Bacteroides fragilis str. 3998 T(B) 4]EXZ32643.1 hypothetical protein M147_3569 [Bacteroides fragilis str. 1007-1-F \